MKVLFAVNNDNISETIVKKYQKEYKEILSYKNVYYFNAIYRELQKDKNYSRIIISEDLEPFANNNYASIDKFLFEKYSNIAEETKNVNNEDIDIILICADRRKKTDDMIMKIYKKNIYNAIIGQDRSIDEICRLINNPRDKEDAKIYYDIQESELGKTESENSVTEAEVENIRAHYARLGKNEDKYIESFNNIVSQYTDTQLKIIIKYLPINVKAVLEAQSPKYQQLVTTSTLNGFDSKNKTISYKEQIRNKKEEDDVVEQLIQPKKVKSVVIPSNITTKNVQKVIIPKITRPDIEKKVITNNETFKEDDSNEVIETANMPVVESDEPLETSEQKRGRGRPRKNPIPENQEQKPKRGRGRPKKQVETVLQENDEVIEDNPIKEEINLFEIDEPKETEFDIDLFNMEETAEDEKEKPEEVDLFNMEEEQEIDLFNISEEDVETEQIKQNTNMFTETKTTDTIPEQNNYIMQTSKVSSNFNTLLTGDKKVVAFVGTTKNGTSFVVNNTAEMLASMGIETAILDMTKTKNAYYIYTNNEESLRNVAKNCMEQLQNGTDEGIKVKKNLTVYTEMPGDEKPYEIETVLSTLLTNYSAILIDTDFDTDPTIFEKVQEIYLIQTMDVLTIQPLTAFLRNLKSKDILKPEKLKIVINKSTKVRSLNIKTLIGGISCYNSPNMTYMTELFNRENIRYCEIPFEIQNYVRYLEALVNCSVSLSGYTKTFLMALKELANMVYPLMGKQMYSPNTAKKEHFSNQVNDTLNKMKGKY